jgi:predicted O-methyltransferase YrrM
LVKIFIKAYGMNEFLNSKGFHEFEGHSQLCLPKTSHLIHLCKDCTNIMEIGFNAGHSAETFLKHTTGHVTSFDLGEHPYVHTAKEYIDEMYPGRHTLILGDSRVTVPEYGVVGAGHFDLLFIDGGHEYDIAKEDIKNCIPLAKPEAIFIMDDTMYNSEWIQPYTLGPTKAWLESDIVRVGYADYYHGYGMSWGISQCHPMNL